MEHQGHEFSYVLFVKWVMWYKQPHCFSPVSWLQYESNIFTLQPVSTWRCVHIRKLEMLCVCVLTISSRLTLAPLLMSSCSISRFPCSAATIRGVCPFWNKAREAAKTVIKVVPQQKEKMDRFWIKSKSLFVMVLKTKINLSHTFCSVRWYAFTVNVNAFTL